MRKLTETRVWQILLCCGLLLSGASLETRAQEKATTDKCIEVTLRVKTADGIPYSNAKIWDAMMTPVVDTNFRTDKNGEVTLKVHPQSTLLVGVYQIFDEKTCEDIPIEDFFGSMGSDYYTKVKVNGRSLIEVTVSQVMADYIDVFNDVKKVVVPVEEVDTITTSDFLYPGGFAALYKYVRDNIEYPKTALDEDLQGLVILRFAVEKDGSIGDVQIKKSLSFECDREAIRVVKSLPRFIPAKVKGVPVRKWFTIPLRFIIH